MLQTILRYLSVIFPHTFGRLAHCYLLFFQHNTELVDVQTLRIAILPTCIHTISTFAVWKIHVDDDDEEFIEDRPGPFRIINDCIRFWFFVYTAFDLIAALDLVLSASGFCGKALLVIDLFVEGTIVLVAKTVFFLSVGIFVGAAFEGFPFVRNFFMGLLISLRLLVLDLRDLREEMLEGNDIPAEDPDEEE